MDQSTFGSFAISASGMRVAKAQLDISAVNLANLHSSTGADGKPYRPLHLVSGPAQSAFAAGFARLAGARVLAVEAVEAAPRYTYDPANPAAGPEGLVAASGVDQVGEMVNVATALRAYQANVAAFNAAKTMAMKALEMGVEK
ncbi:flagellar basal body rod protein FlgC [Massilia endophytica]|uniref:flagellar basal body rod protein FlgC n=1 Tax=Massilia endophytica TaxID=2899220 RepID=UPI001E39A64C|nr:flagellar basal body rod protein FlgC [Massilia endophytica]UGQ47965.1 flagellar basal body rod protein FlgC [Massilia endophytica]